MKDSVRDLLAAELYESVICIYVYVAKTTFKNEMVI